MIICHDLMQLDFLRFLHKFFIQEKADLGSQKAFSRSDWPQFTQSREIAGKALSFLATLCPLIPHLHVSSLLSFVTSVDTEMSNTFSTAHRYKILLKQALVSTTFMQHDLWVKEEECKTWFTNKVIMKFLPSKWDNLVFFWGGKVPKIFIRSQESAMSNEHGLNSLLSLISIISINIAFKGC